MAHNVPAGCEPSEAQVAAEAEWPEPQPSVLTEGGGLIATPYLVAVTNLMNSLI